MILLRIDTHVIEDFCRRRQVSETALFGSILRDDFRSDSDVDSMAVFGAAARAGFGETAARVSLAPISVLGPRVPSGPR